MLNSPLLSRGIGGRFFEMQLNPPVSPFRKGGIDCFSSRPFHALKLVATWFFCGMGNTCPAGWPLFAGL